MIKLLARMFIKNYSDYGDPTVRGKYGMLTGIVGICLNILLFAGKFTAGLLSGAISITADAFNNLTDAGSSLITFIGFKLAGKPTDKEHPFGHGRMEYLAGLIVSMLIFLVGIELFKSSIEKITSPTDVTFSAAVVAVLAVSMAVKLYMFAYNSRTAKKINSAAMRATAFDSISDVLATAVVLISLLLNHFYGLSVDGAAGILVALFILYTGFKSAKETSGLLIGEAPDPAYVKEIEKTVLQTPEIVGVHDLIVHNYGPGRQIISLHAEVPSDENINEAHDRIDNAERELEKKFKCIAVIHMDPVVVNDEKLTAVKEKVRDIVKKIDPEFNIHDFRMTEGPTHENLIFDVVITYESKLGEAEIKRIVTEEVKKINPKYNAVCQVEYSYVNMEQVGM